MKNDIDVKFLSTQEQANYPSGSTACYFNDRFYIMGDDASEILVLNSSLQEERRIPIFTKSKTLRIAKSDKADIEASLIIDRWGEKSILFFGSGSLNSTRDSAFLFVPGSSEITRIDYSGFYNQLRTRFKQLNIEGATQIANHFYLGIRANSSYPDNYIAIASADILSPKLIDTILVETPVANIGLSGMDYYEENDILFITFSSENTSNAIDDGEIGDSYLAVVADAKVKLSNKVLAPEIFVKLTDLNAVFKLQKIESVSVLKSKRELLLVADDDMGNTNLFKLKF